jgi:hypothetical protein
VTPSNVLRTHAHGDHVAHENELGMPVVTTAIVWSPDYDGMSKAWVRFDDGTDALVGESRVERS